MSMPKGKKIECGYATVGADDGENYRTIARLMSDQGHSMNHASARNWMLRVMRKFAKEYTRAKGERLNDDEIDNMARSPHFQSAIRELLQKTA